MRIMKLIFASALLIPALVFAQTEALPGAGFTPESPFYFLDRLGETVREFLTLNPESKARLQITFAAERVAEIKILLEDKGVDTPGLAVASSRLQENLSRASGIVSEQKAAGADVTRLAKELDDTFKGPKVALEETLRAEKIALSTEERNVRDQLRSTRDTGDAAQAEALQTQLDNIKARKKLLEVKKEEHEKAFEEHEKKIEKEMEARADAEEAIREAEEEQQSLQKEAVILGTALSPDLFVKFDRMLAQAKELFGRENYQGAKQLAEQAKESLGLVDDLIEENETEEDLENNANDEREQKEWESSENEDLQKELKESAAEIDKDVAEGDKDAREIEEND